MLDIILENCSIFDDEDATEIGIKKGKIVLIEKEIREPSMERIDLEGAFVSPGFIDSHTHLITLGLEKTRTSLFEARSRDEAVEILKKKVESPGEKKAIIAYRWDESLWKDGAFLEKSDLDFTEMPVVAYRRDGHMATLNSAALRIVGKQDSKDGILKEHELRLLDNLVTPGDDERRNALKLAMQTALTMGITSVRDNVDAATYEAYKVIYQPFLVRKMIYNRELNGNFGKSISEDWGVKAFLDGSIGAYTAAHKGWDSANLLMDRAKFENLCRKVWTHNLSLAAHAIGEDAVRTAVDVFSENSGSRRNSIEHFEIIDEGVLDKMNDSIVVSSQPNFLEWALPGGMYEQRMGEEFLHRNNMYRTFLDNGIRLAFGSDTMPLGPFYGIHYAVNSPFHNQRISVNEAIKCYTEGSAYCLGMEYTKGKLDIGYDADLIMLKNNPEKEPAERIKDLEIQGTMIGGEIKYLRDEE